MCKYMSNLDEVCISTKRTIMWGEIWGHTLLQHKCVCINLSLHVASCMCICYAYKSREVLHFSALVKIYCSHKLPSF